MLFVLISYSELKGMPHSILCYNLKELKMNKHETKISYFRKKRNNKSQ
jgi:hypothetical protein